MIVLASALLSLLAVGSFVQLAKRYGWGKAVRQDGPASHHRKAGTPTMGGAAFLLAALATWLVFGGGGFDSLAVVLLTCAAALLGVYDDLVALRRKGGAGGASPRVAAHPPSSAAGVPPEAAATSSAPASSLPTSAAAPRAGQDALGSTPTPRVTVHAEAAPTSSPPASRSSKPNTDKPSAKGNSTGDTTTGVLARYRLLIQGAAALVFALYAVRSGQELFGVPLLDLLGFTFIIVGSINAFNFTDGLDGLAGGVAALVLLPFIGVGFVGALIGALLGFLWFNAHPARVFMGGVGSEALGAAVAGTAILAGWVWWLPLIALVPVLEVVSVILQVAYFCYTKATQGGGKRLLKMSPLHHHFELSGWSEQQVVVRFWLITAACVALAWGLQGGFR